MEAKDICIGHTLILNVNEAFKEVFKKEITKTIVTEVFELNSKKDIEDIFSLCKKNSENGELTNKLIIIESIDFLNLFETDKDIELFFNKIGGLGIQLIVLSIFGKYIENKALLNNINTIIVQSISKIDSDNVGTIIYKKKHTEKTFKNLKRFVTGIKKNIEGIFIKGNNSVRNLNHKDLILDKQIK